MQSAICMGVRATRVSARVGQYATVAKATGPDAIC